MADNGMPKSLSVQDLDEAQRLIGDMVRHDMWQNIATNLGVENKDHRQSARYVSGRTIQRKEYEAMYVEDPVFAKIVDGIPEHGTRKWIKVTAQESQGDQQSDDVESDFGADVLDALEDLEAQARIFELWRLARLDGGAAMVIGANDGRQASEPLEETQIKSLDFLNVVSRYEIYPSDPIRDVTSPDFRKPEFYMFTGNVGKEKQQQAESLFKNRSNASASSEQFEDLGAIKIHHSRIIRMRGIVLAEASDRVQSERDDGFWGTPIIQRVYDDLRQYNNIFAHVEAGFKDLAQGIMGIKNLPEILATAQGNELLLKRMTLIALAASSFNMVLFDPEHETYEKRPGAFAGVDSVLLRFMEKLSSASEIPMTKLFGMPPAGLSTDDESAEKTFNAAIANKQKRKLRDPLNRIVSALLHASEGPTDGNVPEKWKITFIPLDEPNEKEQADTSYIRAQTDKLHLENGTLDEVEVRSRLKNDPEQPYTLNPDRDEAMESLNDPLKELETQREAQQLPDPTLPEPGANNAPPEVPPAPPAEPREEPPEE